MPDKTVTETQYDFPSASEHPRVPGVVVIFAREPRAPIPWRIERPCSIGRDDTADLTVDDRGVSRSHATIEPAQGGVLVTDNDSHNGTFVNGARISEPRTPAPIGSVIRIAKSLMLVMDDVVPFEAEPDLRFEALVGGASLADARMRIDLVAHTVDPVLIEGETGTGKEVVAQMIHQASGRAGELVGLNCAAIAPELVESELFGHSKGAFSGSAGTRAGLFRTADGGTLLLDEIGELPPAIQAKLLRVLETGEVRGVGEDSGRTVDVRIVAATNRDLEEMVNTGEFRADLLHRIAASRLYLPPLAARREDIPTLCGHFLRDTGIAISATALEKLMLREWPGNVREFRNLVRTAATAAQRSNRDQVRSEDFPATDRGPSSSSSPDESLRARVVTALTSSDGNVMRAARELGVARSGLYETLKRLKLNPAAFRRR